MTAMINSEDIQSGTQWASVNAFETKTTMTILGLEAEKLVGIGIPAERAEEIAKGDFWEFLLLSLSEQHAEGISITSVHSEGMCVYGMGHKPVSVSLQMAFRSDKFTDDHVSFMWLYTNLLRGSRLHKLHLELLIWVEDTHFLLHPGSLAMYDSPDSEDYKILVVQGIGYKYGVAFYPSTEEITNGTFSVHSPVETIGAQATTSTTPDWSEAFSRLGIPTSFSQVASNIGLYFPSNALNLLSTSASAVVSSELAGGFLRVVANTNGGQITSAGVATTINSIKNQCLSKFPFTEITAVETTKDLPLFDADGLVAKVVGTVNSQEIVRYVYIAEDAGVSGGVRVTGTLSSAANSGL